MENQMPYTGARMDEDKWKNTQYIMDSLSRFSIEDSFVVKLDKKQKSLSLSNQIFQSGKRFVLVQDFCIVHKHYISLIAYRGGYKEKSYASYCCNMSTLKDRGCIVLFGDELKYMKESNCFYTLYEQILKVPGKEVTTGTIIQFELPIYINGQIPDDRIGFGVDSSGLNKEYGHTSLHLYVIGMKVEEQQ